MRIRFFAPVFLLLLGCYTVRAQGGISFFEGSWQQALDAARAQKKIVFVDAYTTWCGPCKAMARNTFPNAEVGAFFNREFINYAFDMEKGEGPDFAKKYGVNAYPTLLWIDPDGQKVHTAIGYKTPPQLMNEARMAAQPENKASIWEEQYRSGNRSPEVLLQVMKRRKADGGDFQAPAEAFFSALSDKQLLARENWEAIRQYSTDFSAREAQAVLRLRKKFVKQYGAPAVDGKLMELAEASVKSLSRQMKDREAGEVIDQIRSTLPDKGKSANWLRMVQAAEQEDMAAYFPEAQAYFANYVITDALQLSDAARRVSHWEAATTEQVETAANWARQAVALSPAYAHYLVRAQLLARLGNKTEAREAANIAVRLAMAQNIDSAEAETLLDRL